MAHTASSPLHSIPVEQSSFSSAFQGWCSPLPIFALFLAEGTKKKLFALGGNVFGADFGQEAVQDLIPLLMPWAATLRVGVSAAAPDPLPKSIKPSDFTSQH